MNLSPKTYCPALHFKMHIKYFIKNLECNFDCFWHGWYNIWPTAMQNTHYYFLKKVDVCLGLNLANTWACDFTRLNSLILGSLKWGKLLPFVNICSIGSLNGNTLARLIFILKYSNACIIIVEDTFKTLFHKKSSAL